MSIFIYACIIHKKTHSCYQYNSYSKNAFINIWSLIQLKVTKMVNIKVYSTALHKSKNIFTTLMFLLTYVNFQGYI